MIRVLRFFSIALFCLPASAFCQSNYQPGVVVKASGDTIRGFIDHKEWARNPREIYFKNAMSDATPVVFTPLSARYIKSENQEYISYAGTLSTDKPSMKLEDVPDNTGAKDTVFLEIITTGKFVTLYEYEDKIKDRLFLSVLGETPGELVYHSYAIEHDDRMTLSEITRYKNQLIVAANRVGKLSDKLKFKISRTIYSAGSVAQVVRLINPPDTQSLHKREGNSGATFYAGAGLNQVMVKFTPAHYFDDKTTPLPYFALGTDIFRNKDVGKLGVRAELSLGMDQIYYKSPLLDQEFATTEFSSAISIQLIYNFYNARNFKIYIAPGFRIYHAIYTSHYYIQDAARVSTLLAAQPFYASFVLQGGVIIRKKFEITASYIPMAGSIYGDIANDWSQSFNYVRMGVNYHFVK